MFDATDGPMPSDWDLDTARRDRSVHGNDDDDDGGGGGGGGSASASSISRERREGARRRGRGEAFNDDDDDEVDGRRRVRSPRSRDGGRRRDRRSRSRDGGRRRRRGGGGGEDDEEARWRGVDERERFGRRTNDGGDDDEPSTAAVGLPPKPKEEANFGLSGLLATESNSVRGVALKYVEPFGEAKPPTLKWRLYVFKVDKEVEEPYKLSGSATKYLVGRDRAVVDIPSDHPSCSKQHCVLQFRDLDDGEGSKPYAFDLASTNGTYVNKVRIAPETYVELKPRDVIKFGHSSRYYVLLHEDMV